MKKILVAVDFSDQSKEALNYAMNLADVFGSKVEIMHSFVTIPAIGIDGGADTMNAAITEEGLKNTTLRLEKWRDELLEKRSIKHEISVRAALGDPVFQICDHASEIDAELIVMGTVGESKVETLLFGSTTLAVMRHAACPVLSVPKHAYFKPLQTIVCATGLEEPDLALVKRTANFAAAFKAEIVVFHAFEEDTMLDQNAAEEFKKMLHNEIHYTKLRRESTTYTHSKEAVLDEVLKTHADMLVMRERSRGIFNRLFHPDLVKQINAHTQIPLLTMNDKTLGVEY